MTIPPEKCDHRSARRVGDVIHCPDCATDIATYAPGDATHATASPENASSIWHGGESAPSPITIPATVAMVQHLRNLAKCAAETADLLESQLKPNQHAKP